MAQAPDDAVDRLYGLPLDEFVPARDALAKELRGTGRRDEATAVKGLAKPTVAAWAANQAVRSQPAAARVLWAAGDELAAAQAAVLAGKGSGAELRAATERERAAVEALVDAARGLLSSAGRDLTETTIERVRATLQAAAIDADAREDVAAGRAAHERTPQGLFGGVAAPPSPAEPRPAGRTKAKRGAAKDERERAHGRGARKGEAAERERAAREREREAAAREAAAERRRARKAASARVGKAEKALARAEAATADAAERLEEARATEREAMQALADARAELRAIDRD